MIEISSRDLATLLRNSLAYFSFPDMFSNFYVMNTFSICILQSADAPDSAVLPDSLLD